MTHSKQPLGSSPMDSFCVTLASVMYSLLFEMYAISTPFCKKESRVLPSRARKGLPNTPYSKPFASNR